MPRMTAARIERLQNVSRDEAAVEGIDETGEDLGGNPPRALREGESLAYDNGPRSRPSAFLSAACMTPNHGMRISAGRGLLRPGARH